MKNWLFKASHLRHIRVNMQGVQVCINSVEDGLVWLGFLYQFKISGSTWNLRDFNPVFMLFFISFEVSNSSDKNTHELLMH